MSVGLQRSVLVINCGSSSLKFALFKLNSSQFSVTGLIEAVGSPEARMSWRVFGEKNTRELPGADFQQCLKQMTGVLPAEATIVAVGHRVVHGAEKFSRSVKVDEEVLLSLEECSELAPLHNPANVAGIRAAEEVFDGVPQVAVFDTAFHQTLPEKAYLYAVPYAWYKNLGVRRYGFHGTSHHYVSVEAAQRLGKDVSELSMVTAHLGNGCSVCAIEAGQSVDTTMGLSPLAGVAMGTRSGDVDPALHAFLVKKKGWSLEKVMTSLNKESGLLGLSGLSNDMRTLVSAAGAGDERAQLAIEVFCYQLAKAILGLTAGLSKLDAVVFTGGIGENSSYVRALILSHLNLLSFKIDPDLNAKDGDSETGSIVQPGARACLVVPTNEELMIARETLELINK